MVPIIPGLETHCRKESVNGFAQNISYRPANRPIERIAKCKTNEEVEIGGARMDVDAGKDLKKERRSGIAFLHVGQSAARGKCGKTALIF